MTAIVTAFASTSASALDCRDSLDELAALWARLATATSEEISLTVRTLEAIPSVPAPGEHRGPLGTAMILLGEKTRDVRQALSSHILELEFVGAEASTLARGVRALAESFPLPADLPAHQPEDRNGKVSHCDTCRAPMADPFAACPTCAYIREFSRPAPTPAPTPVTVTDDPEADLGAAIAEIKGDIDAGRITPREPVSPEDRRANLAKEVADSEREADEAQARANLEALKRLEEAEYDQLPAAVWARSQPTADLVRDIGPDSAKQAVEDVADAISAAANGPAGPAANGHAKKARKSRRK